MQKYINELSVKLLNKFSAKDVNTITEIIYGTLKDYDIVPKKNEIIVQEEIPKELGMYLATRKLEGLQDSSLRQYKSMLIEMFTSINKPLRDIRKEDIRFFLLSIKKSRNLSDSTLNTRRSYICAFFSWCYHEEYLEKNPCATIAQQKCEEKLKEILSDVEMERIRIACKNVYERCVFEVLHSTACRVEELTNIKLADIDTERKEVKIIQGKGNKSRITFLDARAIIAISEYLKNRDYPSEYLFVASKKPHNQLSTRSIEKVCKSLGERTGVELYPHKIRRTTATSLWKKGMSIEKIKEMLGHNHISTTLIYTLIDKDNVKQDFQKYI